MAVTHNPSITFKLSGTNITTIDMSNTFVLDNKIEKVISIQDTSPEYELDLSNVDNKKIFVLQGTQDFILHCYKEIEAPVSEETFLYSFDIPIEKEFGFVLNTNDTFFDGLTKLTLSTGSVNMIKVTISLYGEYIAT